MLLNELNENTDRRVVYTIGYSGYENDLGVFVEALRDHCINVLIDVRSDPYSARFNNFNKNILTKALASENIIYRNYANEFGAKQRDKIYYSDFDGIDDRIDYDIFTKSKQFIAGVDKLKKILNAGYTPVIMCSEKDPLKCHRAIMIGNRLFNEYDMEVIHVIPGEKDETQAMLEDRMKNTIKEELKHKKKMNVLEQKMKREIEPSLFSDREYASDVQNYYRIMNSRIGWKFNEILGYK